MLRITQENQNGNRLLRLEGKLFGPWTNELLAQFASAPASLSGTRLDLSSVSFVDSTGAQALRDLIDRGAVVEASSNFVAELLTARNPR